MNEDVIGIGALNVDRLYSVNRIAGPGDEVFIINESRSPGGSAANTIVALSRLGIKAGFLGKVGQDEDGEYILDNLKKEGVETGLVKTSTLHTGIILGFVDKAGERALYAYPGANDRFSADPSYIERLNSSRFVHLSSFVGDDALLKQKILLDELSGPKISFAPGMLYAHKGSSANVQSILKKTDVLFINRQEMLILTGKDYEDGSKELIEKGAKLVVTTLGKEGCFISEKSSTRRVPAVGIQAIDTTGAGDSFAAGFLFGILNDYPLEECGRIGAFIASECIKKMGARDGLPGLEKLYEYLDSH